MKGCRGPRRYSMPRVHMKKCGCSLARIYSDLNNTTGPGASVIAAIICGSGTLTKSINISIGHGKSLIKWIMHHHRGSRMSTGMLVASHRSSTISCEPIGRGLFAVYVRGDCRVVCSCCHARALDTSDQRGGATSLADKATAPVCSVPVPHRPASKQVRA